jgi:hypothetical protein
MILAFDPGLATGVAYYSPNLDDFHSDEIPGGLLGTVDWFEDFFYFNYPSVVIVEKFTIMDSTAKKTRQYDAIYANGYLEARCHTLEVPFVRHTVSNVKTFATNDKLKRLGWYKGGAGHADDAARHLLFYLAKRPEGQSLLRKLL